MYVKKTHKLLRLLLKNQNQQKEIFKHNFLLCYNYQNLKNINVSLRIRKSNEIHLQNFRRNKKVKEKIYTSDQSSFIVYKKKI